MRQYGAAQQAKCGRNLGNGSRTIVHHRDLPELALGEFEQLDLARFSWLHFEGRKNVDEIVQMMTRACQLRQQAAQTYAYRISLELEKEVAHQEALLPFADVVRIWSARPTCHAP